MHCTRLAFSRADWTAGKSNEIKTAMMPTTSKSSSRVKPCLPGRQDGFFHGGIARSITLAIDGLSVGSMSQMLIYAQVDVRFHEPHRAVAKRKVGTVSVVRAAEAADVGRANSNSLPC